MTDQQSTQPTQTAARLIGALLCEDVMVAKDDRTVIWNEYNIITPGSLPYRRQLKVFTKWFVTTAGEASLRVRLFSPAGEMLDEIIVRANFHQGGIVHTQAFLFGQVEFIEPGAYNIVIMREETALLEIPLFVSAPPAPVETPQLMEAAQ